MHPKSISLALAMIALAGGAAFALRQGGMEPVKLSPEHRHIQKLAGSWEITVTTGGVVEPKPSTLTLTPVGEFWVAGQWEGDYSGVPFQGHLIEGYSKAKGKFVGVWVDSMSAEVSQVEGDWDESTKTMTRIGRTPTNPDAPALEEVTVFKNDDHFIATTSMKGEEGSEPFVMTFEYRRKK